MRRHADRADARQAAGQADLFDTRDTDRSRRLMTALDAINRRMGRDTVFYAGSGIRRDWKAYANMKTQHFTTDWRQVMRIKRLTYTGCTHSGRSLRGLLTSLLTGWLTMKSSASGRSSSFNRSAGCSAGSSQRS